jgi:outer membrane lipoprotein-sorting protein
MIAFLVLLLTVPAPSAPGEALLERIWQGVQDAQKKYTSGCGTITETRSSRLLVKPRIFRGRFCAAGADQFSLEYSEPDRISIKFNHDYLNVVSGAGGRHMEVLQVGQHVRRTQAYFSRENSLANLKKNFVMAAREEPAAYVLKLTPRSGRFRRRINYVVVKLGKPDFLLRSLEVDGTSGVNSVFTIHVAEVNSHPGEDTFKVYKPK